MSCQLQLIRLGSGFAIRLTESPLGYQTIFSLPSVATEWRAYVGQMIVQILWDGTALQSLPPQYRLTLVLSNGQRLLTTLSSGQFQLVSKNCKIINTGV